MKTIGNWKMVDACFDVPLRGPQKIILMAICRHYPKSFPSLSTIAREAGLHESTVKRNLPKLEQAGYIVRHRRQRQSTEYEIAVGRILGGRVESPAEGAECAQRTERQGAESATGGRTEHHWVGAESTFERAQSAALTDNIKDNITDKITGEEPEQAGDCKQSLPANVVTPEEEELSQHDDIIEAMSIYESWMKPEAIRNTMPAKDVSSAKLKPTPSPFATPSSPPPPPDRRYYPTPWVWTGEWFVLDTVEQKVIELSVPTEEAANARADELERAA